MVTIIKRNRILEKEEDVFTQNAWDDTEWTQEMIDEAEARVQYQKNEARGSGLRVDEVEPNVIDKWNKFYEAHGDKFFKDRRWLFSEFPEVLNYLEENSLPAKILEIGCGVGNAVAHILKANSNRRLHIYCCDIAQNAVDTMRKRSIYLENVDLLTCFQADICKDYQDKIATNIQPESLDFITMIFTLSALKPELMKETIKNLASLLKLGGMILFRDYAQYDLTQLRFKGKAYLKDNYYLRADGTTSFFFTKDFVDEIFSCANLKQVELKEDNRLLVNRLKSIKMCRRWIQAKYIKEPHV